jgi:hypothetical protein
MGNKYYVITQNIYVEGDYIVHDSIVRIEIIIIIGSR